MFEASIRIERLTERIHALALAMVDLDARIKQLERRGYVTLAEQLSTRRDEDQATRSELLIELVIERQLGPASWRRGPARLHPGRLSALRGSLAPADHRPHRGLSEMRRHHAPERAATA